MRIGGDWLDHPGTVAVCAMLTAAGYRALFVGGCVRDALLGRPVGDIDIATDARPMQVMDLAEAAGIKAVPTGFDHGTVTLVSHGLEHEVTTFRRDVETDGRHALVHYSDDPAEDAARRDFTMNALYATPEGEIVDPLGGLPDLRARRLRFVGEPAARIIEDYLRILRFFRFFAWYGDPSQGMDPEALAAIAGHVDGLSRLSRERVGHEMRKLLMAPDPSFAVAAMRQAGALSAVLPGSDDRALGPLVHHEQALDVPPDPIRRLAAVTGDDPGPALRLSRAESRRHATLRDAVGGTEGAAELGYRFGEAAALDILLLRWALLEHPGDPRQVEQVRRGAAAVFPVRAEDLMPDLSGAALGDRLKQLERRWIRSGFALTRDQLCAGGDG
ncbi:polyA polymerase family protein [Pseudooceanicola batsensis HTCC2597]|uniref:PolyA polymerase family protein n=1 Tax=Pseudooceanicola batsensis (strain ATCC BAA-863 / DSM 15984 / KCTC 12145 / HTCC2597) TaxID=252305 RepID=A3TWN5_PSEBH|nr:CCA tRNA nucleotidyltransferase [Pseudooceanicola batsensis]EAQ04031.1 polyA polymerase family protein [Pseudooceanicola batsensis HTCC2597]